jgi:hypothetical protein
MRKILVSLAILLATFPSRSQNLPDRSKNEIATAGFNFLYSANGEPFSVTKFSKVVEGSPFFKDQWIKGKVTLSTGLEYTGVPVRMNLLEDKVHYLDNQGQEMVVGSKVWQVELPDSATGINYSFVHSSFLGPGKNSELRCWLLALQTGHVGLYKELHKTINESHPYGTATVEQTIRTVPRYYVLKDNQIVPIKKWQNLVDLLSDRKADIDEQINQNKLKGKSESDFVSLVKFYNELSW